MDFITYITDHYKHISTSDAGLMELMAKEILIHNLYPYSFSEMTESRKETIYSNYTGWIIRAINQIIEKQGCTSSTGYTEGGFKTSFDNADVISKALLSELSPKGITV